MRDDHDRASASVAPPSTVGGPEGRDVLSDVLEAVRLTGALFFVVDASSPWIAEAPSSDVLAPVLFPGAQRVVSYHAVLQGRCFCEVAGAPAVTLETGDVVVVSHGDPYVLSDARGVKAGYPQDELVAWFRRMVDRELPLVCEEGGGGAGRLRVLCGFLGCDVLPFNPVLATLPRLLHLARRGVGAPDRLTRMLDVLVSEIVEPREGRRSMVQRIGELLFVEVVRRHLEGMRPEATGWLAGLADPLVGRALAELHARPAQAWTLEALARRAACSRSALAERFTAMVGQPPMQDLTRWRLLLAASRLTSSNAKVSAVAREVGYESEAAFSRAFKKLHGRPPAAWRSRV